MATSLAKAMSGGLCCHVGRGSIGTGAATESFNTARWAEEMMDHLLVKLLVGQGSASHSRRNLFAGTKARSRPRLRQIEQLQTQVGVGLVTDAITVAATEIGLDLEHEFLLI